MAPGAPCAVDSITKKAEIPREHPQYFRPNPPNVDVGIDRSKYHPWNTSKLENQQKTPSSLDRLLGG